MPRVYHRKARKDYPKSGIKKGDMYYHWKFRYSPIIRSLIRPSRSRLTQSSFLSWMYDLEDNFPAEMTEYEARNLMDELETMLDDCQSALENMPEQFHGVSESAIILQDRIDGLEEWINTIDGINYDDLSPDQVANEIQDANPGTW